MNSTRRDGSQRAKPGPILEGVDWDDVLDTTSGSIEARSTPRDWPWVTIASVALCVLVYAQFYVVLGTLDESMGADSEPFVLADSWYLTGDEVWRGSYWALVTSVFVHIDLLHLLFNAIWLWEFGSTAERSLGSWRYLLLFVAASVVTSALQLAVSDDIGIGASGVVYALFAFLWAARRRVPAFDDELGNWKVLVLLGFLAVNVAGTALDEWNVANTAHFTGLVLGWCLGRIYRSSVAVGAKKAGRAQILAARVGLGALALATLVSLVWAPWSATWLATKAPDTESHTTRE